MKTKILVDLLPHITYIWNLKKLNEVLFVGWKLKSKSLGEFSNVVRILKLCFFFLSLISSSQPSTTIPLSGPTRTSITFLEARLGLIFNRPSYRPTGTRPSPRSVLVWRSANRSTSLSSTSMPTLCTHWSLTANTAPPHWVVTRGRRWLVHKPPYSENVTRKGSMLWAVILTTLKQESASLVTTRIIAITLTRESGLVQVGILMTPTRVETMRQGGHQIMEKNTSKPWVIFWSNDRDGLVAIQEHSRKLNVVKEIKHGGGLLTLLFVVFTSGFHWSWLICNLHLAGLYTEVPLTTPWINISGRTCFLF